MSDALRAPRRRVRLKHLAAAAAIALLAVWRPGEGTSAGARVAFIMVGLAALVVLWNAQPFIEWRAVQRGQEPVLPNARRRWAFRLVGVLVFALVTHHAFARVHEYRAALLMSGYDVSDPSVCRLVSGAIGQRMDPMDGSVHQQRINRLGFRGPDIPPERGGSDLIRVALFGDSMIYGVGVEDDETLAVALEHELRAAFPGRRVQVLNFGVPNTTVHTSLRNYVGVGRSFRPDAVVIADAVAVNPNDACDQIREIRGSRLLSWLMESVPGRALVNECLQRKRQVYSRSAAVHAVKSALRGLAADQQATGLEVAYLQHWEYAPLDRLLGDEIQDTLKEITPDELRVHYISGGIDMDEYDRRFAIPGDGHPTAEGQRYYAARIAAVLVPVLRAKDGHSETRTSNPIAISNLYAGSGGERLEEADEMLPGSLSPSSPAVLFVMAPREPSAPAAMAPRLLRESLGFSHAGQ